MKMDGISESFESEKTALISALGAEEKRIQQALFNIGYFAYRVQFQRFNDRIAPTLNIEARGIQGGDHELIDNA
jgi:hypothetical protein